MFRSLTPMAQPTYAPTAPETPAFTLTVAQLREIVREEIQAARAPHQEADRLLDAEEAAKLLSMSTDCGSTGTPRSSPLPASSAPRCSGSLTWAFRSTFPQDDSFNSIDLYMSLC